MKSQTSPHTREIQVTINCAERGLLLLRVRDEIRMTIAAYQTLCVPLSYLFTCN